MDAGTYVPVDPVVSAEIGNTLGHWLRQYQKDVTDKRPGEESRDAETARINRFLREEKALCAHDVRNLRPEHFEDYRDRRLKQYATRGKPGGRGQHKHVEHQPKLRKDGQLHANAARPKAPPKPPKLIAPGTVKRELTLLWSVFKKYKRKIGLRVNPVNTEDVERPKVNDERDARLDYNQLEALLRECRASKNKLLAPYVEVAFEVGPRRGNLLRIMWKDVDMKGCTALLRGVKNSKNPGENIDIVVGFPHQR